MRSYNFYIAYGYKGKIYKVKKEGYQEEYDGFRLNAYKDKWRWDVVEEYSGISFLKKTIKQKKEAFDEALTTLATLAKAENKTIPEFISKFTNVNSYEELKENKNE